MFKHARPCFLFLPGVTFSLMKTDVSVIVVTWEGLSQLPTALAHLEQQTFPAARYEILVVDARAQAGGSQLLERYTHGGPVHIRHIRLSEAGENIDAFELGLREAVGRWVLFLNDDLLAGPHLIESHVSAQEKHGGDVAIVGNIRLHPQVEPALFTGFSEVLSFREPYEDQKLSYDSWHFDNLSLPRKKILDVGGFSQEDALAGMKWFDLNRRLDESGMEGFYSLKARAYAWREASAHRECIRQYSIGYALCGLIQTTGDESLLKHFIPDRGILWPVLRALPHPFCRYFFEKLSPGTATFSRLREPAFECERLRGYRDAVAGRPRAYPLEDVHAEPSLSSDIE